MSIHRIRLLGPWEFEWHGARGGADLVPPTLRGTVKLPCRWNDIFGSVAGAATFSRKFHCPTNLESRERVFLVITGLLRNAPVTINGERLGECVDSATNTEFEVTKRLNKFNRLAITVSFEPAERTGISDEILTEVALEIRTES